MKKIYLKPQMSIVALKPHRLLTGSNNMLIVVTGSNDIPDLVIDYGGIDEDGELDPE